jgi:hypothetical protein
VKKYLIPVVIALAMFQPVEAAPLLSCAEMLRLWNGQGGAPCVQVSACGYVGVRANDNHGCAAPAPTATPTRTPQPTPTAAPRLSCEEMLRIYNAETFHVDGPPCVQIRVCGRVGGYRSEGCPTPTPVVTPTPGPTLTPTPAPSATPQPAPTPEARTSSTSGGGGCLFGPPFCNNVPLAPPVVVTPPTPTQTPCEALLSLYRMTRKNAAGVLVVCNGGVLPPAPLPPRDLPTRLPNAGN